MYLRKKQFRESFLLMEMVIRRQVNNLKTKKAVRINAYGEFVKHCGIVNCTLNIAFGSIDIPY